MRKRHSPQLPSPLPFHTPTTNAHGRDNPDWNALHSHAALATWASITAPRSRRRARCCPKAEPRTLGASHPLGARGPDGSGTAFSFAPYPARPVRAKHRGCRKRPKGTQSPWSASQATDPKLPRNPHKSERAVGKDDHNRVLERSAPSCATGDRTRYENSRFGEEAPLGVISGKKKLSALADRHPRKRARNYGKRGRQPSRLARVPEASTLPEANASFHERKPRASPRKVSMSVSMTFGGVPRRCARPSIIWTAPA